MNNVLTKVLIFAAGAVTGGIVTWKLLKTKYEDLAQEEIDSVKEVFEKNSERKATEEKTAGDDDVEEYHRIVKESGYVPENHKPKKSSAHYNHIILPNEFGEYPEYDRMELIYYADQIVAESDGSIVEDVEKVIGFESLSHFGEYADDVVYVRNDRYKSYYEVYADSRKYADVYRRPNI